MNFKKEYLDFLKLFKPKKITLWFYLIIFLLGGLFWSPLSQQLVNKVLAQGQMMESSTLLQLNSQGDQVKEIQQFLKDQKLYPGKIDGIYGKLTKQAVIDFQSRQGLRVDGLVGKQTSQSMALMTNSDLSFNHFTHLEKSTTEKIDSTSINTALMAPDIAKILQRQTLIVALSSTDNPPFFQQDTDSTPCPKNHFIWQQEGEKLCGLDIEISQGIANTLGVQLQFDRSANTFDEVVDLVYQHKVDLAVSKLSKTLLRAQLVSFSQPYLTMRHALLVNRIDLAHKSIGKNPLEVIRQLDGQIGVIKGSSFVKRIPQNFPQAISKEYPTWDDTIKATVNGEVFAAYRDELEIKKIVLSRPDASLKFQTVALTDTNDSIAISTPWNSFQLLALVNQYLTEENLSYTVDSLFAKYGDFIIKQKPFN